MPWDPTPWMVKSARHSASLGRFILHALAGGGQGVAEPGDLKITALGTPGAAVNAAAGGVLIRNTYAGASTRELYAGLHPSNTQVPIAENTGGAARYDLVVAVVRDPEFHTGLVVPDPLTYQYVDFAVVQNVAANATAVPVGGISGNPPAYVLARIHMPAGANAVTSGQVTDLRHLARARQSTEMFFATAASNETITGTEYLPFPTYGPSVTIPDWATHIDVMATITGMKHIGDAAAGDFYVSVGDRNGPPIPYQIDTAGAERHTFVIPYSFAVGGTAVAGATVQMRTRARRTSGPGYLSTAAGTNVVYSVRFSEKAA